ncbi:MAG: hypothetical protein LBQ05_00840 [Christensenellaceae bacterium]|nr:hypothetical protein [Christensenellaceae bacterium]
MIAGVLHYIIESDPKIFIEKVSAYKKQIKKNANAGKNTKPKESPVLIDKIKKYYERNIKSQVNNGGMKPTSAKRYTFAVNMLSVFKNNINTYTKDNIIDFFTGKN